MPSDFVLKRRLLSNVTNALRAIVTTTEDHGYETGQIVRLIVPLVYGYHGLKNERSFYFTGH
jgi:predicted HAD superfamily phosphohydrolase